MNEYAQKAKDNGKKVGEDLTNVLNSASYENETIEAFVKAVTTSHRTLQQSAMRAIFALIMKWAENEEKGIYDGRNEATVKLCAEIKKALKEENTCLPFI